MRHHAHIPKHIHEYMNLVSGKTGDASVRAWVTFVDDRGRHRARFLEHNGETIEDPGRLTLPPNCKPVPQHESVDYVVRRIERDWETRRRVRR